MKPVRLGPGSSIVVALGGEGRIMARWLERSGHRVEVASSYEECTDLIERSTPDLVVIEVGIPDDRTEEFLRTLKLRYAGLAMLVATDSPAVEHTVATMQAGAYDYLVKPVDEVRLLTVAKTALAFHRLSTRVATLEREAKGEGFAGIIGRSTCMKRLYRQLDRVASADATVLIRGESGSGKELVARAIHEHSSRRNEPFVAVNCAAIPETLQESELFGHEKGAFTGAVARRVGRFEQANGGTLFFDEVGELTPALQAKLLRVLQERRLHRVGGTEEIEVDVRVVAATHRDLEASVAEGLFRQDLFYRIAVVELLVPPLREREGDIPLLAQTFLDGYDESSGSGHRHRSLDIPVLQAFVEYPWPGNVRELQNAVQRAAVLSDQEVLELDDLPPAVRRFATERGIPSAVGVGSTVHAATPSGHMDPAPGQDHARALPAESRDTPSVATGASASGDPAAATWSPAGQPAAPPSPTPAVAPALDRPYLPPGLTLAEVEEFAVRTAFERAGRNVSRTARELGVSRSVLYRKLDRFGIRSASEDSLDHADQASSVGGDSV